MIKEILTEDDLKNVEKLINNYKEELFKPILYKIPKIIISKEDWKND